MKMEFDSASAKGTIEFLKINYGAEIVVNGNRIGFIDLYHLAQGRPFFTLLIDSPDHESPVIKVQFDENCKVIACIDGETSQYVGVCDHPAALNSNPGDWVFTFPRSKESEE